MTSATRSEKDPLGPLDVPADAYYGVQTLRAVQNFPISGLRPLREFVRRGGVDQEGRRDDAPGDGPARRGPSPTPSWRRPTRCWPASIATSSSWTCTRRAPGTSHNMNVNEVLANRANELLGGKRGDVRAGAPERPRQHGPVHQRRDPDGDPAGRARSRWPGSTTRSAACATRSPRRDGEFDDVVKAGRTHLAGRDADPAGPGVRGLRAKPSSATSRASARRRISSAIWASAAAPWARGSTWSRSIRR